MGNLSFPLSFQSAGQVPTYAYASLPAASSVPPGFMVFVSDLGANGTLLMSNGTRWRPEGGTATLAALGAVVASVANTETIVLQTKLPVGAWQANDTIRIWVDATKNGATDTGLLSVHVGTAGTTGDTQITGLSAAAILSAAALSGGWNYDVKLLSTTSAQRVGVNGATLPTYSGASTSAAYAATTITDAGANALFVSVGLASGGTTNTLGVQACHIQLITP